MFGLLKRAHHSCGLNGCKICTKFGRNAVNGPSDWTATIQSLLKGETLSAFESALLDARTERMEDNKVKAPAATVADIDQALLGILTTIFPNCALEIQRIWTTRGMKKPLICHFERRQQSSQK